jgi:hypothetical protein
MVPAISGNEWLNIRLSPIQPGTINSTVVFPAEIKNGMRFPPSKEQIFERFAENPNVFRKK